MIEQLLGKMTRSRLAGAMLKSQIVIIGSEHICTVLLSCSKLHLTISTQYRDFVIFLKGASRDITFMALTSDIGPLIFPQVDEVADRLVLLVMLHRCQH